jgi:hypothetical protein
MEVTAPMKRVRQSIIHLSLHRFRCILIYLHLLHAVALGPYDVANLIGGQCGVAAKANLGTCSREADEVLVEHMQAQARLAKSVPTRWPP